ncbi:MBL fold metallo-hydrolase [Arsenicicoccus sp. oral taxon 190]|uniref:MBL fold metallo-hydrolase n=1 Tax=Arsenicicoccus sp. oral taxon 190 TaxID=1658671 RepID=UPI00067CE3C1|nr:MBL fold metallo-hydrolase [Arsenicicoccus sp. oral taxon 190]
MLGDIDRTLPGGIVWAPRPFPDSNFLLLPGEEPTLVDSGFVAHAEQTADLVGRYSPRLEHVVNTHWHSDHVGGNAELRRRGAQVVASHVDADALARRDPGCCVSEYLDQPVPQYLVDRPVGDGERLHLGDGEWEAIAVPGHTPGHIALWSPEHRLLALGDTLSTYDVGWVDVMRDGMQGIDDSIASLHRLQELDIEAVLPGHGELVRHPEGAIAKAIERLDRQRGNAHAAVLYGAWRILAYALMIRQGMLDEELIDYLLAREWIDAAAATLGQDRQAFAEDLVAGMLSSGALTDDGQRVRASAPHSPTDPWVFGLPFPRDWVEDDVADGRGPGEARGWPSQYRSRR